jgi:hypothetical protein
MFQTAIKIMKWISVPLLLIGSLFSHYAVGFELQIDMAICIGAMILVQRAMGARDYFWAAGFVAVAIVFSPLPLVQKVFLSMALTSVGAVCTLWAARKPQPAPAV